MVLAYVFVQGWVVDPYKHRLFNQPGEVFLFPVHHCEVVNSGWMTWDVTMVKYRGGGFQMFLEPLSKCSSCLSYIFMITFQPVTFISVDNTTLFGDMVLIFRCHQFILYPINSVAITSATTKNFINCGFHKQKTLWLSHLPQWLKTSATNNQLAVTSANNIQWLLKKCDNNICHKNNLKHLAKINSTQNDKYVNFWQQIHPKL